MESIILALSAGSVVPALATAIRAWLQGSKSSARVTITVRDKNNEKVNIELNPENAEQAEEIIQKFLDQYPPEKREADR